jgi:DNA topoisomerase-1
VTASTRAQQRRAPKGRRRTLPVAATDPLEAARSVGLRYVSDSGPGIRRRRAGKGFSYVDVEGTTIRDAARLRRIKALAVPPAWTDVWICPIANGHIQATGRDARGRKQYRYHARFREVRDGAKYERTLAFGQALPQIRAQVERDMAQPGLPKRKVVAAVVRLLELTLIRVGNEEYARQNRSYGLTTMRSRHVEVEGSAIRFRFHGKNGQEADLDLRDRRLASIVRRCQELPGQVLFQFRDEDGELDSIDSEDVNDYLREVTGEDYTAKDFRTWAGTVLAASALRAVEEVDSETAAKRNVVRAIERVAEQLGNTPAVCRSCYVHPAIVESYLDGELVSVLRKRAERELAATLEHRTPEEAAVLALLQQRLKRASEDVRGAA